MTIDDIVERIKVFSGWTDLRWSIRIREDGEAVLSINDLRDLNRSHTAVCLDLRGDIRELSGRLHHWGVTLEERRLIRRALIEASPESPRAKRAAETEASLALNERLRQRTAARLDLPTDF